MNTWKNKRHVYCLVTMATFLLDNLTNPQQPKSNIHSSFTVNDTFNREHDGEFRFGKKLLRFYMNLANDVVLVSLLLILNIFDTLF